MDPVFLLAHSLVQYGIYGSKLGEGRVIDDRRVAFHRDSAQFSIDGEPVPNPGIDFIVFHGNGRTAHTLFAVDCRNNLVKYVTGAYLQPMWTALRDRIVRDWRLRRINLLILSHPGWCEDMARMVVEMLQT